MCKDPVNTTWPALGIEPAKSICGVINVGTRCAENHSAARMDTGAYLECLLPQAPTTTSQQRTVGHTLNNFRVGAWKWRQRIAWTTRAPAAAATQCSTFIRTHHTANGHTQSKHSKSKRKITNTNTHNYVAKRHSHLLNPTH